MIHTTFGIKQDTLCVAYAPDFDMSAYSECHDEALNNLTDGIHQRQREPGTKPLQTAERFANHPALKSMSREARVVAVGVAHHITQRGNARQEVFVTDSIRSAYLRLLSEHAASHRLRILAYCISSNQRTPHAT